MGVETQKGSSPKPEALKPAPQKPEIRGETLFVGEGKPVEERRPAEEKKSQKKFETPKKATVEAKTTETPAKVIIQEAMAKDLAVREVFGAKPIKDPKVEEFIAERFKSGKKLADIGHDLENALKNGEVAVTANTMATLARIELATGEKFPTLHIEGGAPAGPAGPTEVYDEVNPANETVIVNPDLVTELKGINYSLRNDSLFRIDDHRLRNAKQEILKLGKDKSIPEAEIREAVGRINGLLEQAAEETRRVERFSTMYLMEDDRTELMRNPRWMVEQYLRKIEKEVLFADTPSAQAFEHQLTLMSQYLAHSQFIKDVESYVNDPKNATLFPTDKAKQDHINNARALSKELSQKVSFRSNIQKLYALIRGLGDPETISKASLNVGEAGFEFLINENGGVVDVAFNKYVDLYKQARFDKNGNVRRYTGRDLFRIRGQVVEEMKRDRTLYNEMYNTPNGFGHDLTDEDCEAIVGLAEFATVISQQNLVAELGGLGPGETPEDALPGFASSSTSEKILAAMDIQRWFFEKWTNLKPAQRVMWENGCRFAAKAGGRMELIEERLKGVSKGDARFMGIAQEVFVEDNPGRLKTLLEYDAGGHQRKDLPNSFAELSMADLRDRLIVFEGEKVMGEMLTSYDHFSSGWRLKTHLQQIKEIWGDEGENLGLGFRLRAAGNALLGAEGDKGKKDALGQIGVTKAERKGLLGTLKTVSEYRPHALLEFLNDGNGGKYEPAQRWFQNRQNRFLHTFQDRTLDSKGNPIETDIVRMDQVYKIIGRRFIAINELLANEGLPPIDYSVGPTNIKAIKSNGTQGKSQLDILKEVCGHMQTDANEYRNLMQEMTQFVGQPEQIDELTKDQYLPVYRRTRWLDDSRLRYLENPDNAPGAKPGAEDRVPISINFGYPGRSDVDPFVRTWRDTSVAVKTVPEVMASFTVDRKALQKALVAINSNVRLYSGEPYGSRAVFYLLAGWGRTAKTDAALDWLGLNIVEKSSAAKRLLGDAAPSLGLSDLEHFLEEYDLALMSKMKLIAPEMNSQIEQYLGISNKWLGGKETKLPLHLYRLRLFLVIGLLILLAESFKAAQQGEKR